jgi:hypothetical protein
MDHVPVDLIVGIQKSKEGFTAITVSKDIHTGYSWLHPLTTKGATEVAAALMKVICQFGPMKVLHTNQSMAKITNYAKMHHRFGSSTTQELKGRWNAKKRILVNFSRKSVKELCILGRPISTT